MIALPSIALSGPIVSSSKVQTRLRAVLSPYTYAQSPSHCSFANCEGDAISDVYRASAGIRRIPNLGKQLLDKSDKLVFRVIFETGRQHKKYESHSAPDVNREKILICHPFGTNYMRREGLRPGGDRLVEGHRRHQVHRWHRNRPRSRRRLSRCRHQHFRTARIRSSNGTSKSGRIWYGSEL